MRKKEFSDLFFGIFSDFERKVFQTFGQKTSKSCQNYLLRVQRDNLWLEFLLKCFQSFWIFCRNQWRGSQNSIYESRLKIAEKNCFFCFLSRIFSIFERKFFRLLARKLQKVVKTTFCVSRRTICGLNFFLKVLNRFGFSAEPLTWFSNFHLRVQSKNCGRNSFLIFLFRIFSGLWEKKFSDFRPKNFKKLSKLPSTCPEEKFMAWNIF